MYSPGSYLSSHLPLSLPKSLGLQIWEHTGRSTTRNFPLNSSPGQSPPGERPPSANPPLASGVPPRHLPVPGGYPPVWVRGWGGGAAKRSRQRSSGFGGHSRVEPDFLKRHNFSRQLVFGFVYHSVRALSNLLHLLEVLHGALVRRLRPPGAGPGNPDESGPDTRSGGPGGPGEHGSPSSGWNASRAQPLTICPT